MARSPVLLHTFNPILQLERPIKADLCEFKASLSTNQDPWQPGLLQRETVSPSPPKKVREKTKNWKSILQCEHPSSKILNHIKLSKYYLMSHVQTSISWNFESLTVIWNIIQREAWLYDPEVNSTYCSRGTWYYFLHTNNGSLNII